MSDFDFIALDVETANENYWSICQVGLAFFRDRQIVDTWGTLVNPETYFNDFNIGIHGITESQVSDAPCLNDMLDIVNQKVGNSIVAHHMPFDRLAFSQCAVRVNHPKPECRWVDTARIARRTWQEVSQRGYGLANLVNILEIQLDHHHDAVEDARAAGFILVKAAEQKNVPFEKWISQYFEYCGCGTSNSNSRLPSATDQDFRKLANSEPDPSGPLYGEVVVFTGELSISRMEAAQIAYKMGCNIDMKVNRNTTLLVVGDQDLKRLAGYQKSTKHRMAEDLRSKGQQIRIIGEDDFMAMINY